MNSLYSLQGQFGGFRFIIAFVKDLKGTFNWELLEFFWYNIQDLLPYIGKLFCSMKSASHIWNKKLGIMMQLLMDTFHQPLLVNSLKSKIFDITCTAWEVSVFGVILVRVFSHSDWIRRDTQVCYSLILILSF